MNRLTRDGIAEPVSRDQILRHVRGQGNVYFPCSADHEQDWQPYPVDPYSDICDDHAYTHTYLYNKYLQYMTLTHKAYCTRVCSVLCVSRATVYGPKSKLYSTSQVTSVFVVVFPAVACNSDSKILAALKLRQYKL